MRKAPEIDDIAEFCPAGLQPLVAAGADGLMIEVHNKPEEALCDGEQAITPEEFDGIMKKIARYAELEGKSL